VSDVLCEDCGATNWDHCGCEDDDPVTYKELKREAERRQRKANREEDFKNKLKSIAFQRVKGGGREH